MQHDQVAHQHAYLGSACNLSRRSKNFMLSYPFTRWSLVYISKLVQKALLLLAIARSRRVCRCEEMRPECKADDFDWP